jgi:hypothetical protein
VIVRRDRIFPVFADNVAELSTLKYNSISPTSLDIMKESDDLKLVGDHMHIAKELWRAHKP